MKAFLVIQTRNGFAVAPYNDDIPGDFVENMSVASKIHSYSYIDGTVVKALEDYFEPADATPLKVAA